MRSSGLCLFKCTLVYADNLENECWILPSEKIHYIEPHCLNFTLSFIF